jgi:hypothetical protein
MICTGGAISEYSALSDLQVMTFLADTDNTLLEDVSFEV